MIDKIKSFGSFLVGMFIMVGFPILIVLLFVKGISMADKIIPFLMIATSFLSFILFVFLIPLSFFKKTRRTSSTIIFFASYIFGVTLWFYSAVVALSLWGWIALIIGLFIAGIGVFPIAFLASLFNGEWLLFVSVIYLALLTFGSRFYGIWMLEKTEKEVEKFSKEINKEDFIQTQTGENDNENQQDKKTFDKDDPNIYQAEIIDEKTSENRYCIHCGKETGTDARFCKYCGEEININ